MTAAGLAWRYLRRRSIASLLAIVSVALAVGLVATLRSVPPALRAGTMAPASQVPALAAIGDSSSRLILATVLLDPPAPPSMPIRVAEALRARPGVSDVVPVLITHGPQGTEVATTRAYFQAHRRLRLASGRFFNDGEPSALVLGAVAARRLAAPLGAALTAPSGTVVGVLAETGTLLDEAVFLALSPDARSITAVFFVPGPELDPAGAEHALAQDAPGVAVVRVADALRRLVRVLGAVDAVVSWLSWALAGLVAVLLMTSFYNGVRERTRDLAILRAIGARPVTLVAIVTWEATVIGVVGGLVGLVLALGFLELAGAALADVGFAFAPRLGTDALGVALAGVAATTGAGLLTALSVYRIDPTRDMAGVHRPWSELFGARGRRRLAWTRLVVAVLLLGVIPSAMHRASPRSRPIDPASRQLFRLLATWRGDGDPPMEIKRLDGTTVAVEGYQHLPHDQGSAGWRSGFLLVAEDPNHPVELFHEDEPPGIAERIAVRLAEPIEATRYPVRIEGTLRVGRRATPLGEALYELEGAHGRVIALETD